MGNARAESRQRNRLQKPAAAAITGKPCLRYGRRALRISSYRQARAQTALGKPLRASETPQSHPGQPPAPRPTAAAPVRRPAPPGGHFI